MEPLCRLAREREQSPAPERQLAASVVRSNCSYFKSQFMTASFTVCDPIVQAENQLWFSILLAFAPSPGTRGPGGTESIPHRENMA
jgi:hypothetical protein